MSDLTIQKVKLDKNDHPTISLERWYPKGSTEESTVKGCEPWDELTEAMQNLIGVLCETCELGDIWHEQGKVSGVILKPYGDGDGFQIMGQLRIQANPDYVVNFPGAFLSQDHLSELDKRLLKTVAEKAAQYINSLPEQLELMAVAA